MNLNILIKKELFFLFQNYLRSRVWSAPPRRLVLAQGSITVCQRSSLQEKFFWADRNPKLCLLVSFQSIGFIWRNFRKITFLSSLSDWILNCVQVPNGPLDKGGLEVQALSNSNQLSPPPVVIVPGIQNSRTEETRDSELRANTNLWRLLQLKGGQNRVWLRRSSIGIGRAGLWKDQNPSTLSRVGMAGNHTKVGWIVFWICFFAMQYLTGGWVKVQYTNDC